MLWIALNLVHFALVVQLVRVALAKVGIFLKMADAMHAVIIVQDATNAQHQAVQGVRADIV